MSYHRRKPAAIIISCERETSGNLRSGAIDRGGRPPRVRGPARPALTQSRLGKRREIATHGRRQFFCSIGPEFGPQSVVSMVRIGGSAWVCLLWCRTTERHQSRQPGGCDHDAVLIRHFRQRQYPEASFLSALAVARMPRSCTDQRPRGCRVEGRAGRWMDAVDAAAPASAADASCSRRRCQI